MENDPENAAFPALYGGVHAFITYLLAQEDLTQGAFCALACITIWLIVAYLIRYDRRRPPLVLHDWNAPCPPDHWQAARAAIRALAAKRRAARS